MKKLILAATILTIAATGIARADETPPGKPFCFMLTAASDYRMRGISQTRLQPALQGAADYNISGNEFYAGTMISNIKWTKDFGGSGNFEVDLYGGYRGKISKDFSYDLGMITYVFPSNGLNPNANTTEAYGQLGAGPAYIKYSSAQTNLFGYMDSKRSGYLDIGANIDIAAGLKLNLHAGRQTVKNNAMYTYTDWKGGVTKEFDFATVSLAAVGTNTKSYLGPAPAMKNLGKKTLVLTVTKMF